MTYEEAHRTFIQYHLDKRSGERRGRLERGHGHAESKFCVMSGGLCVEIFETCILSMKCWIGAADPILQILLGFRVL